MAVAASGLLLLQMGCAASSGKHPYPAQWPSYKTVPVHDGCPDLAGSYSNIPIAAFPPGDAAAPSLAAVFTQMARGRGLASPGSWGQSWPEIPADAAAVAIDQTADALTVTFVDASGKPTPLAFRRYRFKLSEKRVDDLYACRNLYGEPLLRFFADPKGVSSVSPVYVGASGTFVTLLKADDGSLIVNLHSDSMGLSLLLLGSHYRASNLWYRYPPARRPD